MFSIVVPVYNVEQYVEECLHSIKRNISFEDEVIIVNDGSTDSSEERILNMRLDHRFKYYRKANGGLSDARNFGLRFATKRYIVFLDSDDLFEENSLQIAKSEIAKKRFPEIIIFNTLVFDDDNISIIKPYRVSKFGARRELLPPAAWDKIYKRDLINRYEEFFPHGRLFEDLPAVMPVLLETQELEFSDQVLVKWRQRPQSLSRQKHFNPRFLEVFGNFEILSSRLKNKNMHTSELNTIYCKKIVLDSVIRWYRSERDITHLIHILQCVNVQYFNLKSIILSKLGFNVTLLLMAIFLIFKIFRFFGFGEYNDPR